MLHPEQVAQPGQLLEFYHRAMLELELLNDGDQPTQAYNMLLTRRWLMLVPRYGEAVSGVGFNAMAFAGGILVRTAEQLAWVKEVGLLHVLQALTTPGQCT
jgi:ATP adenylyltransferase